MQKFEIKVTGEGTKREIVNALKSLADSIIDSEIENKSKQEFEDPILMAVITDVTE